LFTVLSELLASPFDQFTPLCVPQLIRTASVENLTTFVLQSVRLLGTDWCVHACALQDRFSVADLRSAVLKVCHRLQSGNVWLCDLTLKAPVCWQCDILYCDTVWSGTALLMFRRNILLPYLLIAWRQRQWISSKPSQTATDSYKRLI